MGSMNLSLSRNGRLKLIYDAVRFWYGFKIADDEYDIGEVEDLIVELEETAARFGVDLNEEVG